MQMYKYVHLSVVALSVFSECVRARSFKRRIMFCTPQTTRVCEEAPGMLGSEAQDSPNNPLYNGDCASESNLSEGVEYGPGMKEARFRIDRKKLEDMLQIQQQGNSGTSGLENAEDFFERVMRETSTQISWPSKLKIGAKSKKDPHVKIVGKIEDVQKAKDKILMVLDTKKNRVTLKMDVSHSDHSYIIGKGGFKIQQVMEETGCHIHFPDSNRNSAAEKSNQVSIAGQAEGVELARCKIRELLPIVFMFELPGNLRLNAGDEASPAVQHIQQTYSFNVAFRPLGLGKSTLMVVRGCQKHLPRLRQGLMLLMEYLTGSKTSQVHGFMKTEIAPQHHQFVTGVCGNNIQVLMAKTGAKITFPDPALGRMSEATPGNQVLQSKSTVLIQGTFDSVCFAWQELLRCLPLILMFDLAEGQEVNSVLINQLMEAFNISIMIRPKVKENIKSVLVRGSERESKLLFKVRRQILGLRLEENLPYSDKSPLPVAQSVPTPSVPKVPPVIDYQKQTSNCSLKDMPDLPSVVVDNLSILSNLISQNPSLVSVLNTPASSPGGNSTNLLYLLVNLSTHIQNALLNNTPAQNLQNNADSTTQDKANTSPSWHPNLSENGSTNGNYAKNSSADGDAGIFTSKERYSCDSRSDMSSQPDSGISSGCDSDPKHSFLVSAQDDLVSAAMAEYENKKITATQAMQQPIGDGVRTPTSHWSGYGFSKSMPDFVLKSKLAAQNSMTNIEECKSESSPGSACAQSWNSNGTCDQSFLASSRNDVFQNEPGMGAVDIRLLAVSSPFSLSNFWENIPPAPAAMGYGSIKDLDQLLSILDLEKYMDLFTHHEIDLPTFLTLSDFDLQQLNISYGARRKMLSAISGFRAAPGAERRALLSRYSSRSSDD